MCFSTQRHRDGSEPWGQSRPSEPTLRLLELPFPSRRNSAHRHSFLLRFFFPAASRHRSVSGSVSNLTSASPVIYIQSKRSLLDTGDSVAAEISLQQGKGTLLLCGTRSPPGTVKTRCLSSANLLGFVQINHIWNRPVWLGGRPVSAR